MSGLDVESERLPKTFSSGIENRPDEDGYFFAAAPVCFGKHTMKQAKVLSRQDESSPGAPPNPQQLSLRRILTVESLGDPWRGKIFSGIRLKGQWLTRAGFHPSQRVTVTVSSPGSMHLRVVSDSATAVSIHVSDPVKEAKNILTEALCHNPQHDADCASHNFASKNRCLPANHPAWESAPACNCWVGRLSAWLEGNAEI